MSGIGQTNQIFVQLPGGISGSVRDIDNRFIVATDTVGEPKMKGDKKITLASPHPSPLRTAAASGLPRGWDIFATESLKVKYRMRRLWFTALPSVLHSYQSLIAFQIKFPRVDPIESLFLSPTHQRHFYLNLSPAISSAFHHRHHHPGCSYEYAHQPP